MLELLSQQPLLVLFGIIFLGIALGNIQVKGLSLGLSGVLFVALVAGHYHLNIPDGVSNLGLALFVYCVGLSAGNRFFGALLSQGSKLTVLTLVIIGIAIICTCTLGYLWDIPHDISVGIFSGACTSTPALAAAMEVLSGQNSGVSIGYGISYPFGVIGVVLFVQLMPRLLKYDLNKEANKKGTQLENSIVARLVKVTNESIVGKHIANWIVPDGIKCKITRIAKDGRLVPLSPNDTFALGQEVLIVGMKDMIPVAASFMGEQVENRYAIDTSRERKELILTSSSIAGKTLRELDLFKNDHVIISRVSRLGFTFVPVADTMLERNDILTVVGSTDNLNRFAEKIGHRSTALNATDLMSLGFGLMAGILLGLVQIGLPGGSSISLGMSGGPLIAALLLGHFGKIGPFVGYIPRPTRILLQDLGLVLFLAGAGIAGGGKLVETIQEYGALVFLMGVIVTSLPMIGGYLIAMRFYKMNILECLGGICGGMTSTPALGAITGKTDSQIPVISYATAYPVALILMTIGAKIIIQILQSV